MKKYQIFFSENLYFLVVKFSVHLNRRVFVMVCFRYVHFLKLWLYQQQNDTYRARGLAQQR